MLLMRRTLLRAPAAATQQQLRCTDSRRNACGDSGPKMPAPKKDVEKPEPEDPTKVPKKDHCWAAMRRSEFKCRSDIEFQVPITFFEAQAKCSDNPCMTVFPPRDLTLYKPSDKLKRVYQRTWCECDVKERKRKAVCKARPITFERRTKSKRGGNNSAKCPQGGMSLGLEPCRRKDTSPCPRVKSPYCKEANLKGCFPVTPPSGCVKRRTKYPAYSECLKDPLPDLAPTECFCINTPPMCVVWNYFRNKKS